MGFDINLHTSKVDISEEDGIDVNLYADKLDISEDDADDIIIEITGLKSLNKFIGLEDTPLYYDNGKFFKVENNKVVYTDIEWKDISGDIQEAPEIVDLITELIEETSEHLVDRHINIHNNSEEAHPYIQNIIQENYNTLDEKVDNLETELSEDISNLNTALNAEITNREDADSVLGARIDSISEDIQAEAITRLENDTILQNNINTLSDSLTAEISTRETADSNLSDSISDLSDDLIQEILDRQAGDNNLDSIKANVSDVESITGALADSISALDSTVSANYETLDDKIDSINGALSDSINSLSSVVSSNYETLDDKIDSVNGALSDSITALDSIVSENYNTLDDKIDSINSALSDSISGLDTKYTSITGALSDSITALDNKYDTITNNLSDSITALDDKYDSITSGLGDEIDNVEGALNTHTSNTSNPHNVTKAQVGLGNVDNTSDLNKPISTATQSALDGKVPNTRTVNNKALSSDITLTYTDVNALPDTTTINDLTTATQQNALNSGINSTLTQQITTNQNNISNLSSTVSSNYTTLDNRITSEVNTLNSSISDEETARINADNGLQSQIDAITSASDVTDIVGTYAELQAYDTTSLPDKSIIKVLQDESRNGETTYYRWVITNGTGAWTLIGEEGPYYTKSEADGRFVTQTTTVNNKALSSNITLTASDVGALPDSTIIGNGTLTIQKNGTTIDTFDANATSNKTISISVPTDTSDLTNNAGFISGITSSDVVNALGYTPENISNKVTSLSSSSTDTQYPSAKLVYDELNDKQETLVSGTNIKTVNNESLLGSGNIDTSVIPPIAYGTSTTTAATVQKVVSIPEITELKTGQVIVVQPTITSTVANSTIKLNDFDPYPMRYNNTAITTSTDSVVWSANYVSQFVFDGTYWQFAGHGYDNNTTYTINYSIDAGVYKSGTGSYAISRYSLCMQKPDMTWEKVTATNANYSTGTSKSVNTNGFILGNIRYYGTTTNVANGANAASNTMYEKSASLDLRYSTNCGDTPSWTAGDYIYFVGTIGSDGLFYLDTTTWWTNTLPSTNDGKLYVQLGKFLSGYNISLYENHPAYYYDGTKLCEYKIADNKQDTLISGTNIKTINNNSLLGNGNITIDSLPSQSGQSGKYLTTNGTTASWSTVSIPTVDQTYDSTSTNAQSGVAIAGAGFLTSVIATYDSSTETLEI